MLNIADFQKDSHINENINYFLLTVSIVKKSYFLPFLNSLHFWLWSILNMITLVKINIFTTYIAKVDYILYSVE